MHYDLIGDIHGHVQTLKTLLQKMGYQQQSGVYRHPSRKVIFLGDFIDRGPFQREVVALARSMIEAGNALAVMGNHEFNAIAYYTFDKETGGYLREHSPKNRKQHQAFLAAYESDQKAYREVIDWFKTLPLWLDLGDLRVIHACWNQEEMKHIAPGCPDKYFLSDDLLKASCRKGTRQYQAIETLLKGKEIPLTRGASFKDKDGNKRHEIRVRWWDQQANSYRDAFLGPESARTHIPDDPIEGDHLVDYAHNAPPVFLGHYWMEGEPRPLAANIACLDYSVAKSGGKLVAYRWDGEQKLDADKYICVNRVEKD